MCYYLEIYFLLFIIYSVLGWIMECTLSIIQKHKFVNRGFLVGPYCPIYGVGVVGVTVLLSKLVEKLNNSWGLVVIFFISMIICGTLEYFTSYIMEKIFNARWWDYSKKKFNINGRVCAGTLIPFGFLSVFILKFSNPFIFGFLYEIPVNVLSWISIVIAVIYIIDTFISFKIISSFKNINKQAKDNTEEISKKVRETAEDAIVKLTKQREKLIRKMKISRYSIAKNIKYTRINHAYKIKNQQFTILENLKRRIQIIDENIKKSTKEMTEKINAIKEGQIKTRNEIKEKFKDESKLNKRLISAFPDVRQREYTRRKKDKK